MMSFNFIHLAVDTASTNIGMCEYVEVIYSITSLDKLVSRTIAKESFIN
ncbi:hypothetical protein SDC9_61203 [bioreactor metagenome]|uniref:Uncharacterized protein n=1 Tax=bioreactor metagenome TaxID=1076179 RepID=A0A644XFH8_9ZZZZ